MKSIRPAYGDQRRPWHDDFVEYMYEIVAHPSYAGLPCTADDEGKIDWIIPSNRPRGSKNWDGNARRREWWRAKALEIGIEPRGKWISQVAKRIHPTRRKPCQTCGRTMELAYVYPTRRTLASLNTSLPQDEQLVYEDFLTIYEVVEHMYAVLGAAAAEVLRSSFKGMPNGAAEVAAQEFIREQFVERESRKMSPGSMSNAPDRLDGFHTYNLCCRTRHDLGRAANNLRTYSDDRRAFEHWCEGDWAAANLLMTQVSAGACSAHRCDSSGQLTADHVGPISLGFSHSPHFVPLCRSCNSAKNNRMSKQDIDLLLLREQRGERVTSWQADPLWNRCKNAVDSDDEALLLSKLLRVNQHHYLAHLNDAFEAGVPDVLLQFLSPEYALEKATFVGLDPQTLTFTRIVKNARNDTYAHSKASRMVRIAYDALRDYAGKAKRNVQVVSSDHVRSASARYRAALDRAKNEPSTIRRGLLAVLGSEDAPEMRATELNRVLNGRYKTDVDFGYVRAALEELMDAYAEVLSERFARGEAVSWDDVELPSVR